MSRPKLNVKAQTFVAKTTQQKNNSKKKSILGDYFPGYEFSPKHNIFRQTEANSILDLKERSKNIFGNQIARPDAKFISLKDIVASTKKPSLFIRAVNVIIHVLKNFFVRKKRTC